METILAQFVTWNNVINDYAVNVQNLLAPVLGAMVAEVTVGRNVDTVQLDLVTPFNKQRAAPQHHILVDWLKNKELREADAALAQARLALMQFCEAQTEAAATSGRASAASTRSNGSQATIPLETPRLCRQDTAGAATLALLTEATGPGAPPLPASGRLGTPGSDRTSSGRSSATTSPPRTVRFSTAVPTAEGTVSPGLADGQAPGGPGRPPGTAESASTDASDVLDPAAATLSQHLQSFNACVSALQQHLGPNFGVYFNVTPAACPARGRCAHVRLMRHPDPAKMAAAVTSGTAAADAKHPGGANGRSSARHGRAAAGSGGPPPPPSRHASSHGRSAAGAAALSPQRPDGPPPGSAAALFAPDEPTPATLVDIVYSGIADALLRAERSVAVVGNELARLFERYEPPLSLVEEPKHCRKLKTLPVAKEYVEANGRIQQLNAVLFKLAKAAAKTAWIYSTPLSLPDGAMGDVAHWVVEAVRRVADTTWAMCVRQLQSVHLVTLLTHHEPFTISPRLVDEGEAFRLELQVDVDAALLLEKGFPDFLPQQMRAVWDALLALAAVVQESRRALGPLRGHYGKLHEEVREFYSMAPDAAKARRLGMADAVAVARTVNANLKTIFEAERVFQAYDRNVARVVEAYARGAREVKADLQHKLAELATKLPRSILKPSFSPEMLALARAAVNPTELAATMTLALTASNMDPAAVALMQQSLAMGAQGAGLAASAASGGGAGGGGGVPGGGAVATISELSAMQQQQQQMMVMQQQQMMVMQQQQQMLAMQQQAAAAYAMYGAAGGAQDAQAGVAAGGAAAGTEAAAAPHAPPPAPDAPALAAHGTSADYAAQLAMAQAYGYANYNAMYGNAYGAYGMYAGSVTGPLAPLVAGGSGAGSRAGVRGASPSRTAASNGAGGSTAAAGATAGAAAGATAGTNGGGEGGAMAGAYQSAGYDPQTIAMLAQMGYGGFAMAAATQQQEQQQQPQQSQPPQPPQPPQQQQPTAQSAENGTAAAGAAGSASTPPSKWPALSL